MKTASVITIRPANETDRQAAEELFYTMSLVERVAPLFKELLWVLHGREDEDQHAKNLPDYCYHILDALKATYLKNFLPVTDIIYIKDKAGLAEAKTLEDAKKVVQMDWKNLGRMCGMGARCIRVAELEAQAELKEDGFADLTPEKAEELFTMLFGKQWVKDNEAMILAESPDVILARQLKQFLAGWIGTLKTLQPTFDELVYQWSPTALIEFKEGFAEGLTSLFDINNQFVGETDRSGTYVCLLVVWPEIKTMLAEHPRKTMPQLHEWLQPFMHLGILPHLDIEQLRDVCAPPSQHGIGLSLRPLKKSSA